MLADALQGRVKGSRPSQLVRERILLEEDYEGGKHAYALCQPSACHRIKAMGPKDGLYALVACLNVLLVNLLPP